MPTRRCPRGSQGNVQALEDGNVFVGWGAEPYFSEFSAGGQLLYDAHMHGSYQSYRSYRFPWTGAPTRTAGDRRELLRRRAQVRCTRAGTATRARPAGACSRDPRRRSWRRSRRRRAAGFETAITTPVAEAYVAVQALDAGGRGARHLAHDRRLTGAMPAQLAPLTAIGPNCQSAGSRVVRDRPSASAVQSVRTV